MEWTEFASVELPAGAQTADLIALAQQLQQQARAALSSRDRSDDIPHVRALAAPVEDALETLSARCEALIAAEQRRPTPGVSPERRDAAESNTNSDDGWRALAHFFDAASNLPDTRAPGRAEAEALRTRLFGTYGLRFINHAPRRQWTTGEKLAAILGEPEVRETLTGLGAERFVKAALDAHRAFGLAYGFTVPVTVEETVTSTRSEQLALQAAVREYVLKVSAQVIRKKPETGALARFLLQPYAQLVSDLGDAPRSPKKPAEPPSPPAKPEG